MKLTKFALTDKTAIVTGSGKGIGKGIALGFAEVGANVAVADIDAAAAEATAAEIRGIGRRALALPIGRIKIVAFILIFPPWFTKVIPRTVKTVLQWVLQRTQGDLFLSMPSQSSRIART